MSFSNYNPLTTVYTPATSCFGLTAIESGLYLGRDANGDCLPHQGPPGPSIPSFYSPGICPLGYSSACPMRSTKILIGTNATGFNNGREITLGPGESGHKCCPSGYQCAISDFAPYPYTCTDTLQLSTPTTVPYWNYANGDFVSISNTVIGVGQWTEATAFAVCVKWKSDDLSLLPITEPVPSLVLETIRTGPPTSMPTHSAIPLYTGSGDLLQGYCATPDYVLLDGPTAYWAPVIGCEVGKTDCCPYFASQTTLATAITVTVVSTVTVNVGPGGTTQSTYSGLQIYPALASSFLATLAGCPDDYQTISGGCCPSGYKLWNGLLGGQFPCYSSLSSHLVPPPVPVNDQIPLSLQNVTTGSATASTTLETPSSTGNPTSAIVNVVYAFHLPVQPSSSGLSPNSIAGIGVGGGVVGIALLFYFVWRVRRHKEAKQVLAAAQTTELDSTRQDQRAMSSMSPNDYSTHAELQTVSVNHPVQTPGSFVEQEQGGHFPKQQMQQGLHPQSYFTQQPAQQMPQMQEQSPVHYQKSAPTVSLAQDPEGYGYYSGYAQ